MSEFNIIPNWAGERLTCTLCGTDKSVKYAVKSNGAVFPCCNKCVIRYFGGE